MEWATVHLLWEHDDVFYDTAILRAKGYQKLWPSNTIAPFWIPMEEGKGHEFYYDTAILGAKGY
jgi:hypothetical protein